MSWLARAILSAYAVQCDYVSNNGTTVYMIVVGSGTPVRNLPESGIQIVREISTSFSTWQGLLEG